MLITSKNFILKTDIFSQKNFKAFLLKMMHESK